MRFLVIIVALICVSSSPAFSTNGSDFGAFIKSREVVATLYFQSNDENLNNNERERLFDVISKLRELQKNGRMIRVEGFSSQEGDQERNFLLSFFRARSVVDLIEGKGLPAEVTLTGYGDLRASSDDPSKERRVEIASYLKPVVMKRIKVVDKKKRAVQGSELGVTIIAPKNQEIDSYSVDQAIRRKLADKNKGLVDRNEVIEQELLPGLSQTKDKVDDADLDRGYSQWRKNVDPDSSPKLSQSKAADDRELKRGYTQWRKSVDPASSRKLSQSKAVNDTELKRGYSQWKKNVDLENSPAVTQVLPVEAPVIDALMIEQAIMEKIGTELVPSGTVTQVNLDY